MERLDNYPIHESVRGYFGYELYKSMAKDPKIILITGDLGYGMLTPHMEDFGERFINAGAAEQTAVGMAVGLAKTGKIPLVYSITTFLIYRPFEVIRNYINKEQLPVKLVGSGRDYDYAHDGFSHHSHDVKDIITTAFPNIIQFWPETKEEIPEITKEFLTNGKPGFLSLRR